MAQSLKQCLEERYQGSHKSEKWICSLQQQILTDAQSLEPWLIYNLQQRMPQFIGQMDPNYVQNYSQLLDIVLRNRM